MQYVNGSAGQTSWTDQLDEPAGRTSWTDQFSLLEALASLYIVAASESDEGLVHFVKPETNRKSKVTWLFIEMLNFEITNSIQRNSRRFNS